MTPCPAPVICLPLPLLPPSPALSVPALPLLPHPQYPVSFHARQLTPLAPTSPGSPQTLGPVLRSLLPSLFPSSRDPVLANVVLHGAPVPFSAPLEELMREAAYPDGWLCLIITLL